MNKKYVYMVRGIGMGFIVAAIIFFMLQDVLIEDGQVELTQDEITEKALDLGMIPVTKIDEVYLNDEQVIERAKELGMEFVNE